MSSELKQAYSIYIKQIELDHRKGNDTEITHRDAFSAYVKAVLTDGYTVSQETKQEDGNKPDYEIESKSRTVGFIETKKIDYPLDRLEGDDQLQRYFEAVGNVITTNYLEFRWYSKIENTDDYDGSKLIPIRSLKVAHWDGKRIVTDIKDPHLKLADFIRGFTYAKVRTVRKPVELARRMSSTAKMIRDSMTEELAGETNEIDPLSSQLESFRETIIADLSPQLFADMYAETISYGLFSAKNAVGSKEITWQGASHSIPATNPFLKRLFNELVQQLPPAVTRYTNLLVNLMNAIDLESVMKGFGKGRAKDPVFHFYETFLSEYNPSQRERRGVYYTPKPVVRFIVRSVDHILRTTFGLNGGLANAEEQDDGVKRLTILDPATGTGTFLHEVLNQIFEEIGVAQAGGFDRNDKGVNEDIIPRLYGFELMIAPYTIAHLKLGMLLAENGYQGSQRLNVYLTNALEEAHRFDDDSTKGLFGFTKTIMAESEGASKAKSELPVMVVLGNPPYSGHSANDIEWMDELMRGKCYTGNPKEKLSQRPHEKTHNYFEVDGKGLGERNPKWLNDDYVKFIRWGQWRIEQTGAGVLAFITNHGYLDNPTFRGMRQSLLEAFDEIYITDLHGNAKKKEVTPSGGKDENVFDIQQGVAIGIFVKHPKPPCPAQDNNPLFKGVEYDKVGFGGFNKHSKYLNKSFTNERIKQYNLISNGTHLPYADDLKDKARELRKSQTPAEKKLWYEYLSRLDLRFKRQHPIDNYIVDFYCTKLGLVIEIDGSLHNEDLQHDKDKKRTAILEKYGLTVIRFSNDQVLKEFKGVCQVVDSYISKDKPPYPAVQGIPPRRGGCKYATVYHHDLWGVREIRVNSKKENDKTELVGGKYHWLDTHSVGEGVDWKVLNPQQPFYLFSPFDNELAHEYECGVKITDLFPTNSVGIVTARDKFVIDFERNNLVQRLNEFCSKEISDDTAKRNFLSNRDKLDVSKARNEVRKVNIENYVDDILYRPFDTRPIIYLPALIERSRDDVMKHMLAGDNVGLITTRQVAVSIFNHSLITNSIIDNRLTRSNKGICYLFPLYLYPHGDSLDVKSTSWREGENGRIPNLNRKLIEGIAKRLGVIFISEGKGNIIQTPLPCTAGRPPSKRGGKGPPFEGGRIRFWRIRGVDNRSRGHPQLHLRHPPQPNLPHPLRTIPEDGLPPCALHLQPGAVCQTLSHRLKTYQPASA
jgi:very-short-patch-repair endonuclease